MLCGDGVRLCHGWVTQNPAKAHKEGWHVKPWEESADIPLLYRGRWALLTESGEVHYI